jgi:hypothetical protein
MSGMSRFDDLEADRLLNYNAMHNSGAFSEFAFASAKSEGSAGMPDSFMSAVRNDGVGSYRSRGAVSHRVLPSFPPKNGFVYPELDDDAGLQEVVQGMSKVDAETWAPAQENCALSSSNPDVAGSMNLPWAQTAGARDARALRNTGGTVMSSAGATGTSGGSAILPASDLLNTQYALGSMEGIQAKLCMQEPYRLNNPVCDNTSMDAAVAQELLKCAETPGQCNNASAGAFNRTIYRTVVSPGEPWARPFEVPAVPLSGGGSPGNADGDGYSYGAEQRASDDVKEGSTGAMWIMLWLFLALLVVLAVIFVAVTARSKS